MLTKRRVNVATIGLVSEAMLKIASYGAGTAFRSSPYRASAQDVIQTLC